MMKSLSRKYLDLSLSLSLTKNQTSGTTLRATARQTLACQVEQFKLRMTSVRK